MGLGKLWRVPVVVLPLLLLSVFCSLSLLIMTIIVNRIHVTIRLASDFSRSFSKYQMRDTKGGPRDAFVVSPLSRQSINGAREKFAGHLSMT